MEILLEHTVNSLFPRRSGQNHFPLTSLYTLFRSNITHSPHKNPPSEDLRQLPTGPRYTNQHLQDRGECQLLTPWQIPGQAFHAYVEDLLWWQNPTLPCWASRLMECKVPFNISTGVTDRGSVAQGSSFDGKPRTIFHKSSFFLKRTGDIEYKAKGD